MLLAVVLVGCLLSAAVGAAIAFLIARPHRISADVKQMAEDAARKATRRAGSKDA